jgi:hypothetical protein
MNGRIFDPLIGRFLQTDPFVQDPGNLQNFDRFGYCYNNPTTCVDPSGHCFMGCFWQPKRAEAIIVRGIYSSIRRLPGQEAIDRYVLSHPWLYSLGMAVAGYWGGPQATAAISGYAAYVQSDGNIAAARRAAVVSYATSMAFYAVGTYLPAGESYASVLGNAAGHAVVGCAAAVANNGSCKSGAYSAGFSAWAGGTFNAANDLGTQMVIGGIASRLGGGTFANGALTAAYGYINNCLAHGCNMRSEGYGRTEVYLEFKNIPGGDGFGASDPSFYPQHAYVIVRDTISSEDWISRAGPGGAGEGIGFGTVNAVTTLNTPGSTLDYGAKVNARYLMFTTDVAGAQVAAQLGDYSSWVNSQGIPYSPLHMNSNTYAFHAIKVLTGNQPMPFVVNGGASTINAPASQH